MTGVTGAVAGLSGRPGAYADHRARATCESGDVVSLLARLPRRGAGGPRSLPLAWLAVAAILAVDLAGLAGLGLASSSSRPSTRPAACPSAGPRRWPASCGSWRRAVSSSSDPAPSSSPRCC